MKNNHASLPCSQKNQCDDYLFGWLDEKESLVFEKHLAVCPRCQKAIQEDRAGSLSAHLPPLAPLQPLSRNEEDAILQFVFSHTQKENPLVPNTSSAASTTLQNTIKTDFSAHVEKTEMAEKTEKTKKPKTTEKPAISSFWSWLSWRERTSPEQKNPSQGYSWLLPAAAFAMLLLLLWQGSFWTKKPSSQNPSLTHATNAQKKQSDRRDAPSKKQKEMLFSFSQEETEMTPRPLARMQAEAIEIRAYTSKIDISLFQESDAQSEISFLQEEDDRTNEFFAIYTPERSLFTPNETATKKPAPTRPPQAHASPRMAFEEKDIPVIPHEEREEVKPTLLSLAHIL